MNAENDGPNQNAIPESSGAPCSAKCPDCRGYGNHAYGDGLEWWNVKCETCNGTGKTKRDTSPNAPGERPGQEARELKP